VVSWSTELLGRRTDEALLRILAGSDQSEAGTAGEARLYRLLVARWVVAQECNLLSASAGGWCPSPVAALRWLDRLVVAGYQLSDAEIALRAELAARVVPEEEPDPDDDVGDGDGSLSTSADDQPGTGKGSDDDRA
jgi:hypothetical protein